MLIRLEDGAFSEAADRFSALDDEAPAPADGRAVVVSLARLQLEAPVLLAGGRAVGVRLEPAHLAEDAAPFLPGLALVAVAFPKFRDGRGYSTAALLRERFGWTSELRAVGDVLVDQAAPLVRVGFDAFDAADGSTPQAWAKAAGRFRHVYQAAADTRPPAFGERAASRG